ncbi:MAG: leucine-rich repeat domain-containing protein, partial [Clostridia bacterium]|nr:leucine-rich repeat domain-containing protein [Clostridia bacterium]
MRKKLFLLVLILFALIAVKSPLDLPVSAATGGTTGQCTWSLDGTVLTISGNGAMANYSDTFLPPWYDSASAITQLYINEGVTSIGDYSFAGCTSLTAIILPNGSLNRIGNGAFLLCYSTDYFAVPASVTELGVSVFAGCYNLQNLLTVAGNPIYASSGNCIIERASGTVVASCPTSVIPQDAWVNTIGEGAFMLHYGASSLYVPGNITTIGEGAFYGLQSIVTLSEGLKTIGAYAFSESNLSYVYLPSSLEEIGEGAFMYCLNINGLSLPEGIKSIGADAYFGCNFKNAVTIPKSVQFIGESAFSANPDLPGFNLAADHPYFTAAGNCLVEKATGTLITGCSNSTIFSGEGVRSIGDYAFAYTNISSIQIPDGVTSIGEGAFIGCENLKAVRIPSGVTKIGEYAFANCTNFTELSLSGTIPTFPESALENTPHANRTAKIWYEGTPQDLEGAQLDFTMGIWHYVENSCKTSCTECSAQRSVHFDHRYASLCDETCDACAITRKVNADHTFDDSCDELCNKCRFEREAHVFSDPCDTECNVCASTRAPNHYTVIPVPAHTTENCPSYPFTSNEGWYQSTNKDHNSTSTFSIIATHRCSFTVTCRFSCEVEHDYLHIRRNALDVWGGSGTGGQPYAVPVSLEKGDVLTISYSKDGSGSKGDDCIWFTLSCGCEDTIQVPSSELEASCDKAVICSGCGETVKSALDHSYSFECDKSCNLCGFVREASHKYDGPCDISCNICQQERFAP